MIGVICIRPDCMLQFMVSMAIAIVSAFAATMMLGGVFGNKEKTAAKSSEDKTAGTQKNAKDIHAETGNNKEETGDNKEETVIFVPIQGNVILRENIPDETFASGVLGDGAGIEPETGEVSAPFDGEISSIAETRHAIGITGPDGMELLIHVGVDTVKMNGDGFTVLVSEGDKVRAGQKLMTFDISKIKAAGYSTTSAVLLTNSDEYQSCHVVKTGKAEQMEKLITVKR